jgi:hypothetical protein
VSLCKVKVMNDGFKWLDDWLESLSELSIRLLIFFGIALWITIACILVYTLFSYDSEIEYTFHGHPIDVKELKKEDN